MVTQWDMPITNYPYIVDRDNQIRLIYNSLIKKNENFFVIEGNFGNGKTFLAKYFSEKYQDIYPGGISYCSNFLELLKLIESWTVLGFPLNRYLIIADELTELSYKDEYILKDCIFCFSKLKEDFTNIDVLMIGNPVPKELKRCYSSLNLGGLTEIEAKDFLLKVCNSYNKRVLFDNFERIMKAAKGNLRQIINFMNMLQDVQGTTVDKIETISGIIDIYGNPLDSKDKNIETINVDLACANDQVFKYFKENPEGIYQMSSREFELFIASILERMGYKIRVTPQTRDGGVDIYAAKKDGIGAFLYLLQCKKQNPVRPVGIGVIREMYGVLQIEKATYASVVTTSYFTKDAVDFQKQYEYQISLLDFQSIKDLLYNIVN